ncbi:MAG: DUF2442 domain-containing protein [Chloroflexi bacterium]|nr:DUF2442 domain-containing protein [Chloroflexota bacterium]
MDISFTDDKLIVDLADDRSLLVPLSWYPRLFHATLAGRRSGESEHSIQRWLHNRSAAS